MNLSGNTGFGAVWLALAATAAMSFTRCGTEKSVAAESNAASSVQSQMADTSREAQIQQNYTMFAPVLKKLEERGVARDFLDMLMREPKVKFDESFVKINVTGYLKKADYSHNFNEYSIQQNKAFLAANDSLLRACESQTGVPKEVIASVMWVETKHGKYLGKYNVASAYLSLALAVEPENIQKNKEALRSDHSSKTEKELKELDAKIEARAKKKSSWALDQIVALEKMQKMSPVPVGELYGSWAGAFGLSQFLPSSYLSWAKDGNGDGKVNLYEVPDATFSIANYLKVNGWGDSEKAQRKAVFHYNNSNDYVDAVLTLAGKITEPSAVDNDATSSVRPVRIHSPQLSPAPGH